MLTHNEKHKEELPLQQTLWKQHQSVMPQLTSGIEIKSASKRRKLINGLRDNNAESEFDIAFNLLLLGSDENHLLRACNNCLTGVVLSNSSKSICTSNCHLYNKDC